MMVKDSVKFLVDTMIKNESNLSSNEGKESNEEKEGTIRLTAEGQSAIAANGSLCLC